MQHRMAFWWFVWMRHMAAWMTLGAAVLSSRLAWAEHPYHALPFGSPSEQLRGAKEITNPYRDETDKEYELPSPAWATLGGVQAQSCALKYFNNRLWSTTCQYPIGKFDALRQALLAAEPKPYKEELQQEKRIVWYGPSEEGRFLWAMYLSLDKDHVALSVDDSTQRDFHFTDLLHGVALWVLLALAGLFVVYFAIAWWIDTRCPKCKKHTLELQGTSLSNLQNYSPSFLSTNLDGLEHDKNYHYKCRHCGHTKTDVTSGFTRWHQRQKR